MKVKSEREVAQSCPTLSDPAAYQAPPSMRFSRQEYWSGLPLSSPDKDNEGNDIIHLIDLLSELSELLNVNLIHIKQQ